MTTSRRRAFPTSRRGEALEPTWRLRSCLFSSPPSPMQPPVTIPAAPISIAMIAQVGVQALSPTPYPLPTRTRPPLPTPTHSPGAQELIAHSFFSITHKSRRPSPAHSQRSQPEVLPLSFASLAFGTLFSPNSQPNLVRHAGHRHEFDPDVSRPMPSPLASFAPNQPSTRNDPRWVTPRPSSLHCT